MKPQPRYHRGDRIANRYRVHQALMGGMGEVYLCLDLETNLPYALKTFQQRYLTDLQQLRRAFEQEVATWVALEKHPNIVRCFYMSTLDNQPFMVLEWIANEEGRGTDLRSWLRRGPVNLKLALQITIDICNGLIHAQTKRPGLVHRDLKPENILIAQGGLAKITDFGLAQIVQASKLEIGQESTLVDDVHHSLLSSKGIAGTPAYMAPEQWRGEVLDERTDIYAIGCILYEILTGQRPFQSSSLGNLKHQHLEAAYPQLIDNWASYRVLLANGSLTFDTLLMLNTLLNECLAKHQKDRVTSVRDLLQRLLLIYQQQFDRAPRLGLTTNEFSSLDFNLRGSTYSNLGLYDKALSDYEKAIQLDMNNPETYNNRGITYCRLKQYEAGLADYNLAIHLDPTSKRAYLNRANLYGELHQYENALADYAQAIQLDPNNQLIYYNRGSTYIDLQRYLDALADFNQAIQLDPNYAAAYFNRGNINADLQHYEEALADYSQVIRLDPTDAEAYFNRGVTYNDLQKYDEALADYNQTIHVNPDFSAAYFNIGTIFSNRGQWQEALPYFEQAERLGHPQGRQYGILAERMADLRASVSVNAVQIVFNALQQANSADELQRTIAQFSFDLEDTLVDSVEKLINSQVPLKYQAAYKKRLQWLNQLVKKQHASFWSRLLNRYSR